MTVNLNTLSVGDTITLSGHGEAVVLEIDHRPDVSLPYSIKYRMPDGFTDRDTFRADGYYHLNREDSSWNIIKIQKTSLADIKIPETAFLIRGKEVLDRLTAELLLWVNAEVEKKSSKALTEFEVELVVRGLRALAIDGLASSNQVREITNKLRGN